MLPALVSIQDLPDFLQMVFRLTSLSPNVGALIFRGQAASWDVLPKAGRPEYRVDDLSLFHQWRSDVIAYSPSLPENDFECLAIAQHYGLATRLLDWSTNPLVALYFACESHITSDGMVYCFPPSCHISSEFSFDEISVVARFTPRPFDPRILVQSSCFTYHPNPIIPLDFPNINKNIVNSETSQQGLNEAGTHLATFTVPANRKETIRFHLSLLGIHRRSLFPDIEGLSSFLNWQNRNPMYLAQRQIVNMNTIPKTTKQP